MPAGKLEMSFLSRRPELVYVQKVERPTMSVLGDTHIEAQLDLGCAPRTLATQPLNFATCSTPVGTISVLRERTGWKLGTSNT